MKLFLITAPGYGSYEEFVGAVVVAKSKEEAKRIYPGEDISKYKYNDKEECFYVKESKGWERDDSHQWPHDLSKIKVEYIGEASKAIKRKVILDSYHHG